tara:strand:- start:2225 stop:4174 length:1950 start_codon:yes stop_codon:yes gene_type:complete
MLNTLPHKSNNSKADYAAAETVAKLNWRSLSAIFLAAWPYIRPVLSSLIIYAVGVLSVIALFTATAFIGFEVLWDSVGQAKPLAPLHAQILFLPTREFVEVSNLLDPDRYEVLWRFTLFVALLTVILTTSNTLLDIYKVSILQRINQSLRIALVSHMHRLSLQHNQGTNGDAIYRVFQDSAMVTAIIENVVVLPVISLLRVIGFFFLAFLFSPWIASLFALGVSIIVVTLGIQNKRLRENSFNTRRANGALFNSVQASIQGLLLTKAYGQEGQATEDFARLSKSALAVSLGLRERIAAMKAGITVILAIVLLGTDYLAAFYVFNEASVFGASLLVFFGLTSPIWSVAVYQARRGNAESTQVSLEELVNYWCLAQDMAVGLGRTWDILNTSTGIQDPTTPSVFPHPVSTIKLSNINYAYNAKTILQDISLELKKGEAHVLVGPSGAGKSTLLSLLARLDDPKSGAITFDGINLRDFRLADLRGKVGIALQENILFPLTLAQNIGYAAGRDFNQAELETIAEIACLGELVEQLPQGFDTHLGANGDLLSSGQRQRVAIARLIAANPAVVLLDEPTDSLDPETAARVLQNILNWAKDRILLIISHQLELTESIPRITVLKTGRIVAQGNHQELLTASDLYRDLHQAGKPDAN